MGEKQQQQRIEGEKGIRIYNIVLYGTNSSAFILNIIRIGIKITFVFH